MYIMVKRPVKRARKPIKRALLKRAAPKRISARSATKLGRHSTNSLLTVPPLKTLERPYKPTPMPKIGDMAPDFSLPDANGSLHALSDHRGRQVVLYFYPKDDTPGCTLEAQGFRDDHDLYLAKNATVIGVSKDTCDSHRAFMQKYGLNFLLLSDVTGEAVERYGCWVERLLYGKRFMGIQRATFIIDERGRVKRFFPKVTPEGHSAEVMRAL